MTRGAGLVALLWLTLGGVAQAACRADAVDLRGDFGTVRFDVELALTPAEQSRGLMFRESLPRFAGMLFVYDRPRPLTFWMRNTLIPLDIIFLDESGRVLRVHENAVPGDETTIPSGGDARAVLEINGGLARQLGLEPGVELRHPALPQASAGWACAPG